MTDLNLKVNYLSNTYASNYSDIFAKGYFTIEGEKNSLIELNNNLYKLVSIYFEASETLEINTLYFVHSNIKNPTQFVYIKLPIRQDSAIASNASKYATYTGIRKLLNSIQYATSQSEVISFKIHSTFLNETDKVKITTSYSFTNSKSGDAVTMIELSALITSVNDPRISFKNINGVVKPVFKEPNIIDKNNQPPTRKEGFTESFTEGLAYTCKRKGTMESAVINSTIMGPELSKMMIKSRMNVTITALVMFFVCILAISLAYLSATLPEAIETESENVASGETATKPPPSGGGQMGGMGELCSHTDQKTLTGFVFVVGIACIILNLYGAMFLKDMKIFYLVIIFVVGTLAYYVKFVYKELTIHDLELEHVILYNREKPVVKWLTISAHYVWVKLVTGLMLNKGVTILSFSILQGIYLFFVMISYLLYRNYDLLFSRQTSVAPVATPSNQSFFEQMLNGITSVFLNLPSALQNAPIFVLIAIGILTNIILTAGKKFKLKIKGLKIKGLKINPKLKVPKEASVKVPGQIKQKKGSKGKS